MKTFVKNRDGNEICVVVENVEHAERLAFVMHGLGGNKDQPFVRSMVEAFIELGYTVVSWDAVHTFGESRGGLYEDATTTNYYADLEDVIAWSSRQEWYTEPFVLCGHSLGGISIALYAENHPEKVRALAPISTVVSGALSVEGKESELAAWERDGVQITTSHDGTRTKRLKWSHMEDRLKYDLLDHAAALTMPVLLVVGSEDSRTPPRHQQLLFDALPGEKELHIIPGALHSFYEHHEQQALKETLKTWLGHL